MRTPFRTCCNCLEAEYTFLCPEDSIWESKHERFSLFSRPFSLPKNDLIGNHFSPYFGFPPPLRKMFPLLLADLEQFGTLWNAMSSKNGADQFRQPKFFPRGNSEFPMGENDHSKANSFHLLNRATRAGPSSRKEKKILFPYVSSWRKSSEQ